MSWDILVATIEHRADRLALLLDELAPQVLEHPSVGIIVYRDNLEAEIGTKRQALIEASVADYISFIDDDDMVPSDHVSEVIAAMADEPDYIGWEQRYTLDGVTQNPVYHSLRYQGEWVHDGAGYYRGITHFNQIKRELALLEPFEGGLGEDNRWSQRLEARKVVKSEVYIPRVMHFHDQSSVDDFHTVRVPLEEHPELIEYPCVRYLEVSHVH